VEIGIYSSMERSREYQSVSLAMKLNLPFHPIYRSIRRPTLSLLTPNDLHRTNNAESIDVNSNVLDLRPDPVFFVRFLKSINRPDISADLFVRLLETYQSLKAQPEDDPLRFVV
jgi:hypothetical protein